MSTFVEEYVFGVIKHRICHCIWRVVVVCPWLHRHPTDKGAFLNKKFKKNVRKIALTSVTINA